MNKEFKAWLEVVEQLRIEPYFAWVPREENVRADTLSKLIPLQWGLSTEALSTLTNGLPGQEWKMPDFNQFGNMLLEARDAGKDFILVHPVW
ncbi:MAG: hypothetical protein ACK53L_29845, partial [Pirellulaceae bacterium]